MHRIILVSHSMTLHDHEKILQCYLISKRNGMNVMATWHNSPPETNLSNNRSLHNFRDDCLVKPAAQVVLVQDPSKSSK